jgi:hypothetical protein
MPPSANRAAVDTSALLALASSRDQYHARALATATRFQKAGGRWIGTTMVLGELHGHLLHRRDPDTARRVVGALIKDPAYEWHDASVEMVQGALTHWIDRFPDQGFSLTDAVTFELMKRERVKRAYAFDQHFVTAGFELL